ncbi:hypothetical protein JCM16303_006331 [Sporobolomyces ruberrimus]
MRDPRLPPSPSLNSPSSEGLDSRLQDSTATFSRRYPAPATSSSSSFNAPSPAHYHFNQQPEQSVMPARVSRSQQQHYQQSMEPVYSQNPQQSRQHRGPAPPQYFAVPPTDYPAPRPTPPAPVHRVYVLNCASCDTFLTNRGMRAVLLLKPHIVLFSTDAPPCNAETSWPEETVEEEHVERTCDCLTSSIACHGCGRIIGYHIVAPCSKCTDSVQKHQRSANHHRFVFHHNEVSSRERTYYPGERGVHNPVIVSAPVATRPREPSPAPIPVAIPRRRVSIYDVEKDLLESRLAPPVVPSPTRRQSPPPVHSAPIVTLLKAGDVLYWHHLVNGGERTKPIDPRTREPVWTESLGR